MEEERRVWGKRDKCGGREMRVGEERWVWRKRDEYGGRGTRVGEVG